MHADLQDSISSDTIYMLLSHTDKGQTPTIKFPIASAIFARTAKSRDGIFKYINGYWATLSHEKQTAIFRIYQSIEHGMDHIHASSERSEFLMDKLAELYQYHNLEDMVMYLTIQSDMCIPDDVPATFVMDADFNHTEEKTYLRGQYRELAALSTVFKTFIPVWGTYIREIKRDAGRDFKELEAFLLLRRTSLLESAPVLKILTFVEQLSGEAGMSNPNNIYKGITTQDFSFWMTARTCIRRVTGFDIGDGTNLIKILSKAIKQPIGSQPTPDGVNVKKQDKSAASDGDQGGSVIEGVRVKSNLSPGNKVELEHVVSNIHRQAKAILYSLQDHILEDALNTSSVLMNRIPVEPQIILMKWVMCQPDVFSHHAPDYVGGYHVVRMLAATQAILWQTGHRNLAMLVTAEAVTDDEFFMASTLNSHMHVPQERVEEVTRYYPYNCRPSRRQTGPAPKPEIVRSIDSLAKKFASYQWRATANPSLLEAQYGTTSRTIVPQPDIKQQLTRLVTEMAAKVWI